MSPRTPLLRAWAQIQILKAFGLEGILGMSPIKHCQWKLRVCLPRSPVTAPLGPRLRSIGPLGQCGHKVIVQAIIFLTVTQMAAA